MLCKKYQTQVHLKPWFINKVENDFSTLGTSLECGNQNVGSLTPFSAWAEKGQISEKGHTAYHMQYETTTFWAYVQLKSVVGKIVKLESWEFLVGKIDSKLESTI